MRDMTATNDRTSSTAATPLLRGFAPLVVAALLALLVVLLVPSVAPERMVAVPSDGPATTAPPASAPTTTPTTVAP